MLLVGRLGEGMPISAKKRRGHGQPAPLLSVESKYRHSVSCIHVLAPKPVCKAAAATGLYAPHLKRESALDLTIIP